MASLGKILPFLALGAGAALLGHKTTQPTLPGLPAAPDPNADEPQKQLVLRQRQAQLAAAMGTANITRTSGGTILTSAAGLTDAAPTTRKTLLGQ